MTSGAGPALEDRMDLIAQASAHGATQSPADRGTLRIYLGIAPGVGKTYAMLRDARARRRSGLGRPDKTTDEWRRPGHDASERRRA